jgi:hypothetical protein
VEREGNAHLRAILTSDPRRVRAPAGFALVLREDEACMKISELCRKHDLCGATFYIDRPRYGGMSMSEAPRLRTLDIYPHKVTHVRWASAASKAQVYLLS